MRFVTLEAEQNFIEDRQHAFMLLRTESGELEAVPAKCPHRGGPLHLGSYDAQKQCIRCPWHQSDVKLSTLRARALPLVSARGVTTVVLQGDGPKPSSLRRRILDDCAELSLNTLEDTACLV
jgi:nitrite reductase/ring-hydroxylating ferredoxin subunit